MMARKASRGPRLRRRLPVWILGAGLSLSLLALNWWVQVFRKPSELAGLLLPSRAKSPADTWAAYGRLFEAHATDLMTPEFLAALAQAESSGDPLARTYWRWRWTADPLRLFSPASSAVGLMQVTDATFGRCRDFCVRAGRVERRRPWHDLRGCWFNGLYSRLVPSHSVELVSACLHEQTERLLEEGRLKKPRLELKQDLAAVAHLCGGRSRSADRLKRGLPIPRGERCGDHDPRGFLAQVRAYRAEFARLRREGS